MPSSIRPARDSGVRTRVAPPEMTMNHWPLRDQPLGSSIAMTVAAGASWLAVWATGNPAIGLLVAGMLAVTLWRTWLPIGYELGGSGITQILFGWRRRIPWTAILHYEIRDDGVLLFPDEVVTPLSPLRGLYLHWGQEREELLAQLQYYLQDRTILPRSGSQPPAATGDQTE